MRIATLIVCTLPFAGCTCGSHGADADGAIDVTIETLARSADIEALWNAAEGDAADDDDLMRLANEEGATGLVEMSLVPERRVVALRAMAFAKGYAMLPALGDTAAHADEPIAILAADSAVTIAARKRAQIDPEDALELKDGCGLLLAAAKDTKRPRNVRVSTVNALRMLADTGCVKLADIPQDVNAK